MNMRYLEIISEGRDADLYHTIRMASYAVQALESDHFVGTTAHKFWADGRRRGRNDPDYDKSFYMKGISTTRDIRFAKNWGNFVFILDQAKLSQKYKIIPFHWGFALPDDEIPKKEREEFVVSKRTFDTYTIPADENDDETFEFDRWRSPEGIIGPLSSFLKGILVGWDKKNESSESYRAQEKKITSHPKFRGYFDVWKTY